MSNRKNNSANNLFFNATFGCSTGNIGPTNISSTALLYSCPIDARYRDNFGVQVKATSGVGSFFLDNSANYTEDIINTTLTLGDWLPPTTSFAQISGSTALLGTTFTTAPWPWYRVRFVPSSASSTGTIDVWVSEKQS